MFFKIFDLLKSEFDKSDKLKASLNGYYLNCSPDDAAGPYALFEFIKTDVHQRQVSSVLEMTLRITLKNAHCKTENDELTFEIKKLLERSIINFEGIQLVIQTKDIELDTINEDSSLDCIIDKAVNLSVFVFSDAQEIKSFGLNMGQN